MILLKASLSVLPVRSTYEIAWMSESEFESATLLTARSSGSRSKLIAIWRRVFVKKSTIGIIVGPGASGCIAEIHCLNLHVRLEQSKSDFATLTL